MINYKIIAFLILVVTIGLVKGQYNESDCSIYGNWTGDKCECNTYYTGILCNTSCYFDHPLSCTITNCSVLLDNSVQCYCEDAEDAVCLFDECSEDDKYGCSNNGNCYARNTYSSESRYVAKCLCKDEYTGITCNKHTVPISSTASSTQQSTITETITQTTTTEATIHAPPEVNEPDRAYPTYGPRAGGTKVVIHGLHLNGINAIYLDENVTKLEQESNDTTWAIITPSYEHGNDETSVILPFSYSVIGQSGDKTNTSFVFEYRPNPTVSDIFPKKAIRSGGTSVTVTGTYFDSVVSPKFKVYVRNRTNDDNDDTTLIEIHETTCEHKDGGNTQLLCRFPNISSVLPSRRKRFVEKANNLVLRKIREAPTTDQLQFTLGLEFDGADHYEDLADSNPRLGFIDVHPDPKFQSDQEILFDPAVAKVIGIKGEDIDSGTVVEDYKVYIGDANCTDIGLTFDKLYCSPPENIDDIKNRGPERNLNEANVTVHIGINLRHYVGFITYNTEDPTVPLYTLFIPVVAAIGGVLLILFIILIVCACRKSGVKDEPLTAPSVTDIDNMAPTGNDNYYTGQTAPKDQYYMVVNKDDRRKGSLPPPDKNAVDGRI